jgi:very-short-patch-repair endonuclease
VLRTRTLEDQGYRVLRFSNWEVDADLDGVLRTIAAACGIELDAPLSGTG